MRLNKTEFDIRDEDSLTPNWKNRRRAKNKSATPNVRRVTGVTGTAGILTALSGAWFPSATDLPTHALI